MDSLPRPSRLTLRRWLNLYLPLALTFLLMSGSSPIINKGIGRLADETIGLAAFLNAFVISLFLYSPCFVVRDACQKFIRGRTSYRRALLFHLGVSTTCSCILLFVAITPVADDLLLRRLLRLPEQLVGPVKHGILSFLPIPTLIILRGVHQAVHITNDTPKWIGIGTACRFLMIIAFVFLAGVPLDLPGAVMGGLALTLGIAMETIVNVVTSRRRAGFLRTDPDDDPPPSYRHLWAFAGPLFLANAMGVFLQPLSLAIVNGAIQSETSAAAFNIVRSFTWFFSSTLFATQTMVLAKADTVANFRRLAAYTLLPVIVFSALILVTAFVAPIRAAVLVYFFEIDSILTVKFIIATLPLALILPTLMALRSMARGLIVRSGYTFWVTTGSLAALIALLVANGFHPSAGIENGTAPGFVCWMGAMGIEFLVLLIGIARLGVGTCVGEGRRGALRLSRRAARPSGPGGSGG